MRAHARAAVVWKSCCELAVTKVNIRYMQHFTITNYVLVYCRNVRIATNTSEILKLFVYELFMIIAMAFLVAVYTCFSLRTYHAWP